MSSVCTGVILAGGENTRFDGHHKALMRIGDERILDRIFAVMSVVFDDLILVTNTPERYLDYDATIVTDILKSRSALTGIHTGLFYARSDYAFFTAGDTPFLKEEMIRAVVNGISPEIDIVMPETGKGREPLCAVYSRNCLETARHSVENGRFKIMRAFRKKNLKVISEKASRTADPRLLSFFNVNTPADLQRAEYLARENEMS